MNEVSLQQVTAILGKLGVRRGRGLLVHSAIQFLGRPAGGVGLYLEALRSAAGPEATLAVPAFNFGFARGEPYDPQTTPGQGMGAFSEYVRRQPGAQRTSHPMQSLALLGPQAAALAGRDTRSAFDPGSAFEGLLEMGFDLLLLGADVQAVSMIHYSEQRAAVPYRSWKDFSGQVRTPGGWQPRTYSMFARDLQIDPQLDLRPLQTRLEAKGQWQVQPLNYGWISLCRLGDFVAAADELLAEDAWALVGNRVEAQARRSQMSAQLSRGEHSATP